MAKLELAALGIRIPSGRLAKDLADARATANEIGFPVALKAQSAKLSHKSDAGGVALNLKDSAALDQAWANMQSDLAHHRPGLGLDGVLVESMCSPGLELIVGARRDPEWGPVLMIGLGGVFTEALHDVRVLAPDLSVDDIVTEFARLRGAALLGAFRGQAPRDVRAAAEIVARIGAFIRQHGEVVEIDVNPLMTFAEGQGAMALDALIVTSGAES